MSFMSTINEAMEELRYSIRSRLESIDRYQSPWEIVTESGTDALGDFEIVPGFYGGEANQVSSAAGYYRVKPHVQSELAFPPVVHDADDSRWLTAFDLSNWEGSNMGMRADYNYSIDSLVWMVHRPKRLIFPNRIRVSRNACTSLGLCNGGIYLPGDWQASFVSDWVRFTSDVEIPVKCPERACTPYYLNKIGVSVDNMVALFNNLDEPKSWWNSAYITLGSTNLAKLTEEQKEIAYAKGWDLQ